MNKNISNSKHISRTTMLSLLEGKLNAKERQAVNTHIESCELCRDACNGLKQMPDIKALSVLNNKWNHISSKHKLKRIEVNLNTFYIIFTFALVIIIALIFLLFFNKPSEKQSVVQQPDQLQSTAKTTYSDQPESFISGNNMVDSIETHMSVPVTSKPETQVIPERKPGIEPLPIKEPSEIKVPANAKPVEKIYETYKTKSIRDLIIIDYSSEYVNESDTWKNMTNGLAARYSNKNIADSIENNNSKTSFHTTYDKVLDHAFYNLSARHFDKSIEDFSFILQYFPDDLNCIFYTGFALENNSNFNEALNYYTKIINTQNPVFADAARYHAARCQIEMHNIAEAKALLNVLIETKSFYAFQAKEKLNQLK